MNPDWEDLDIFFDEDEFAVPAVLTLADGTTFDLTGIYETPYMKRDLGELIVDADDPSFTCKWQSEFEAVRQGDRLTISDEVFYIEGAARNDGTGVASFVLTRGSTQDAEGDVVQENPQSPQGGQNPQNQRGQRPYGNLFESGR